ncbi:flavin reductase family protein [Roseateles sp. PN1]|uniref:flavin reductase family protein n=1 Tax=Roseateles sp. PN1 TaxID=3137372 RepID=UPI0031395C73
MTKTTITPAIHYWGTPVLLISTLNEDASANLAPMSSAWWLGWSCMLGLDASSKTVANLRREGECVLNLASTQNAEAVDRLALLTGSAQLPAHKRMLDYRFCADKFGAAGLSAEASTQVAPPRVRECQVQLEAQVVDIRPFAAQDPRMPVPACMVELRLLATHVDPALLESPGSHRIAPQRWQPLLMKFRQLYGDGAEALPQASRLASAHPEEVYAPWKFMA